MAWFRNRIRHLPGGEDGFSLIELLAALTILLVGILGVAATLSKTRDAVTTSEVREAAVHRAERELERLRATPYDSLRLASTPAGSADQSSPAYYVQGTQYRWDPANAASVAPFVMGGTTIAPQTTWSDGRFSGTLHRYITTYVDPAVTTGTAQAKRLIVGVTVNGRYALNRPTIVSTVVHQPPVTTP